MAEAWDFILPPPTDAMPQTTAAPFTTLPRGGVTAVGTVSGTGANIAGKLTTMAVLEASQAIERGNAVALDSAGTVSRTRATALSTVNANTDSTDTGSVAPDGNKHRFIDVSSTVKLAVYISDDTVNAPKAVRVVVDPSSSTITSATHVTITSASSDACTDIDAIYLTTNTVVVSYVRNGQIYSKVLSGLDAGVTQGAEFTGMVSATCALANVSATEFISFGYIASTEVRAQRCTISGTTISGSTTSTVYATATTQSVKGAVQYASTGVYLVCFSESTTTFRGILGHYSGGSLTMGTAVTIESFNPYNANLESIDKNRIIISYTRASSQAVSARVMSRSNLALTANSALALGTGGASGYTDGFCKLGKLSFVSCVTTNATTNTFKLLEVIGFTISAVGSSATHTTSSGRFCLLVKHSPTRFCGHDCRASVDRKTFSVDLTTNHTDFLGIAAADIRLGLLGRIVTHGISEDVGTLSLGNAYYTDIDGAITADYVNGERVGFAISSTKLDVKT